VMVTIGLALVLEPIVAQHQHARHVLTSQGDQKQRQRDTEQGIERELRQGEHWGRELQLQPRQIDTPLNQQEGQPQCQNAHHRVACGKAFEHDVGNDQQPDQHRVKAHAAKSTDAELQQDTGQQPCGHTRRDQSDDFFEIPG